MWGDEEFAFLLRRAIPYLRLKPQMRYGAGGENIVSRHENYFLSYLFSWAQHVISLTAKLSKSSLLFHAEPTRI